MCDPDAEPWNSRLEASPRLLILGASVGTVIGLVPGLGKIAAHGYWDLGFRRTIFLESE